MGVHISVMKPLPEIEHMFYVSEPSRDRLGAIGPHGREGAPWARVWRG